MESMSSTQGFDWELHVGRVDELDAVARLGRAAIGEAHPDAEALALRVEVNPEILRVFVRRAPDGRAELCGYSLLYPLTEAVGAAIAAGQIRAGKELGPESLLPEFARARYLYIAMLLGTDADARAHAKADLREELGRRIGAGQVESVFARPATASGLRLLRARGFVPIAEERDIWSLSSPRFDRALGADPA
jgi:hypothetical protein